MVLDYYLKSPPALPSRKGSSKYFSGFLIGLGVFILLIVFASMGWYQWKAKEYSQVLILGKTDEDSSSIDYTNPHVWFSTAPQLPFRQSKITHYSLSVPVLNIYQAVVEIGGEDLGKSMIHYPGTALPGQVGNAVVFCHSVLPQFFNPKNYKTICSTLPTIEIGNEILIHFDGVEYFYQIVELIEVDPGDISVLNQNSQGEYLSLITCVPPGTYLKRLVVRARLI